MSFTTDHFKAERQELDRQVEQGGPFVTIKFRILSFRPTGGAWAEIARLSDEEMAELHTLSSAIVTLTDPPVTTPYDLLANVELHAEPTAEDVAHQADVTARIRKLLSDHIWGE